MGKTHVVGEIGPIIEDHYPNNQAKIWFSAPVVTCFGTYEKRCELTIALKKEINNIPSDYVPYGTFIFKELVFIYCYAWVEEQGRYLVEIDLATDVKQIGEIPLPEDMEQLLDEIEVRHTSIH